VGKLGEVRFEWEDEGGGFYAGDEIWLIIKVQRVARVELLVSPRIE
jgi:hypothetical protein